MNFERAFIIFLLVIGAAAIGQMFLHHPAPLPSAPPCDCESRLADLDRRCTDAMARQVALLRSCEMRCPQEEPTP